MKHLSEKVHIFLTFIEKSAFSSEKGPQYDNFTYSLCQTFTKRKSQNTLILGFQPQAGIAAGWSKTPETTCFPIWDRMPDR